MMPKVLGFKVFKTSCDVIISDDFKMFLGALSHKGNPNVGVLFPLFRYDNQVTRSALLLAQETKRF